MSLIIYYVAKYIYCRALPTTTFSSPTKCGPNGLNLEKVSTWNTAGLPCGHSGPERCKIRDYKRYTNRKRKKGPRRSVEGCPPNELKLSNPNAIAMQGKTKLDILYPKLPMNITEHGGRRCETRSCSLATQTLQVDQLAVFSTLVHQLLMCSRLNDNTLVENVDDIGFLDRA